MIKVKAVLCALTLMGTAAAASPYVVGESISAPDELWDYVSVDDAERRLYIGGFGGVTMVDLATGKVSPDIVRSSLVHGVAPLPHGLAAATNGDDNTVTIFDGATGKILSTIAVGKGPDGISFDRVRGWLIVTEEDGASLSLVDPIRRVRIKSIALGGAPEAAVADKRGTIFDNMGEKPEIVVVDPVRGAVTQHIALPGCDEPTGIAYDPRYDTVVSACRNGAIAVLDARTRKVRDSLKVGAGPDAVMIDTQRSLFFVPSGGTGQLTVLRVGRRGRATIMQTIATEHGSRTGAVDQATGIIYLPAATLLPPTKPGMHHSMKPGTFHILAVKPGGTKEP